MPAGASSRTAPTGRPPPGPATLTFNLSTTGNNFSGIMCATTIAAATRPRCSIAVTGNGYLTFANGNINYTGSTTVSGGTLNLVSTTGWASPSTINGGELRVDTTRPGNNYGLGTFTVNPAGTLELFGSGTSVDINNYFSGSTTLTGAGTINKTGAGYVDFAGGASIKNFAGQINVQAGCLATNGSDWNASAGSMNLFVNSGAIFDIRTGSAVVNQLSGSGTVGTTYTQTPTLTIGGQGGSSTFSGIIQNSLSMLSGYTSGGVLALTKSGNGVITLTGANSYTGNTTVSAGTLAIAGNGYLYSAGTTSPTITVASGAALLLSSSYASNNPLGYGSSEVWNVSGLLGMTNGNVQTLPQGGLTLSGGTLAGPATGGEEAPSYSAFHSNGCTITATGNSFITGGLDTLDTYSTNFTLSPTSGTDSLTVLGRDRQQHRLCRR